MPIEDQALIGAFVAQGSQTAFATLVDRYTGLVYSAALRQVRGDVHLAREVAQIVFTDLARRAPELRDRRTLSGWLYTGTHYAAVQILRRESRRLHRETEAHFMTETSPPSLPETWERVRPVLDDVMDELSAAERESILLRYFEGHAYADIGRAFDVSENTARMRVERALDKMHALLSRRGVTSTSGALAVVLAQQAIAAGPAGLAAELSAGALAAAPTVPGTLATFLAGKAPALTLGAAALVGVVLWVAHLQTARELRAEVAALRDRQTTSVARLATDRAALASRSVALTTRARFLAAAPGLAPADSSAPPTLERLQLIRRIRSELMLQHASLLVALQLPADTQPRFESLLLAKTLNEVVVLNAYLRQKPAPTAFDDATLAPIKAAATRALDDEIAVLLGPEKFSVYRHYDQTRALRRRVEEISAAARHTPLALDRAQSERLVGFIAQHGAPALDPAAESIRRLAAEQLDANEQAVLARLQTVHAARRTIVAQNRDAAAQGQVKFEPLNGLVLNGL